jgi:hypothetical protein
VRASKENRLTEQDNEDDSEPERGSDIPNN